MEESESYRINGSWPVDAIPEASKARLREEHQRLDPFALKKSIEGKLKKFFTALGNLDSESTKA